MPGCRNIAALVILLLQTGRLCAGLYNTAESAVNPRSMTYVDFRIAWDKLRAIGSEQVQSEHRRRYLLVAGLFDPRRPVDLTPEQRLNLSEYLIRLRRYPEAVAVLEPVALRDPSNFLVLSNLGTAYQLLGQGDRAIRYLEQAKAAWPKTSEQKRRSGIDDELLSWYRQVEEYQLRLLRLRAREAQTGGRGGGGLPEEPDALFDDNGQPPRPVRFVGESGQYEAGQLAASEKAKLPANARQIVEQLLVWLPDDNRLYWLLAELLNAHGDPDDVEAARKILDDLSWSRGFRTDLLQEHRRILAEWTLPKPADPNTLSGEQPQSTAGAMPAWQPLAVAFGAGALLGLLAAWQFREIRRRLAARLESET